MKRRLPPLKARQVLRVLERAGFVVHHSSGSHRVLKHPQNPALRVVVPFHSKDLKRRTLESIVKQAGLTLDNFMDLI